MLVYIYFIIGFIILIKGADFLVDGASSIARRLNISDLVIGLTVVAFGTSTPELFVNIIASFKGNIDIAIGNVIGSNIANVFLILGLSSIIYPLAVTKGTVWKEVPFSLLAAIVLFVSANDQLLDGSQMSDLTRIDGLVFLSFFIIFIYYTFSIATRIEGMEEHVPPKLYGWFLSFLYIILGLIGLTLGGKWIVDGAVALASKFGMSESLVGLTIVAVGTSLPELATSAVAAYKRNVEIAVGNVVGSNIFNIFFCLRHQCNHKAAAVSNEKQPRHRCSNFSEFATVFVYVHRKKAFIRQMGRFNIPRMLWSFRRLSCFHRLRAAYCLPSTSSYNKPFFAKSSS